MRVALLVAALLAGCVGSADGDEVNVHIENRTGESHTYEVVAWWDAEEDVQRGRATGTIEPGAQERLFSFHAPCEDGKLVYVGALANGTSIVHERDRTTDCGAETVTFVLEPPRARFVVG